MREACSRRAFVMGGLGALGAAGFPGVVRRAEAQSSGAVTVRLGYQPDLLGSIAMVALKERIFEAGGARATGGTGKSTDRCVAYAASTKRP